MMTLYLETVALIRYNLITREMVRNLQQQRLRVTKRKQINSKYGLRLLNNQTVNFQYWWKNKTGIRV